MKLRNSQIKSRKGFEGVRTLFQKNPKYIGLLGFEIWHYDKTKLRNFPEISNNFSVFITHSFYVSYSGLIKLTKSFSFC